MKMRTRWSSVLGFAVLSLVACGGSGDEEGGTGGKSGSGGNSGSGGTAGDGGLVGGSSGTGASSSGGTGAGGTAAGGVGGTAVGGAGGTAACVVATCQGKTYECGDCKDNDADGLVDSKDPDCWGACQDNESGYKGNIPGQQNPPCNQDCYFDQDSGAGNDQCYWDHHCDPFEVAPNFPPEGSACGYDPNTKVVASGGPPWSCTEALNTQKKECLDFCGPLVPNGCDCFGCCVTPGASTPIWLGSVDSSGKGTCTPGNVADPSKCKPCTIVKGCFNDCKKCELCFGKTTLPADCTNTGGTGGTGGAPGGGGAPSGGGAPGGGGTTGGGGAPSGGGGTGGSCVAPLCPAGVQACGLSCLPACPSGTYCVTGCCQKVIK